jgi:acyl-coenzyme A synthetase/AMP-(fatty) acid ligase
VLVEFVDELPLTVTGKIRWGELRRLEVERLAGSQSAGEGA